MAFFTEVTFDQIAYSALAVLMIREGMIAFLPDTIAGPGGWLVNTSQD